MSAFECTLIGMSGRSMFGGRYALTSRTRRPSNDELDRSGAGYAGE